MCKDIKNMKGENKKAKAFVCLEGEHVNVEIV